MKPENIRIELPEDDAMELTGLLKEKRLQFTAATSRQMTGETLIVSVVLPVTLTAVQVLAAYFLAKKQQNSKPPGARIEVRHRYIKIDEFTIEVVEAIVEHRLLE